MHSVIGSAVAHFVSGEGWEEFEVSITRAKFEKPAQRKRGRSRGCKTSGGKGRVRLRAAKNVLNNIVADRAPREWRVIPITENKFESLLNERGFITAHEDENLSRGREVHVET